MNCIKRCIALLAIAVTLMALTPKEADAVCPVINVINNKSFTVTFAILMGPNIYFNVTAPPGPSVIVNPTPYCVSAVLVYPCHPTVHYGNSCLTVPVVGCPGLNINVCGCTITFC